jgi:hypothetical protein
MRACRHPRAPTNRDALVCCTSDKAGFAKERNPADIIEIVVARRARSLSCLRMGGRVSIGQVG